VCLFIGDCLLRNGEVFLPLNVNKKSGCVLLAFVYFERFNQNCCNETNR